MNRVFSTDFTTKAQDRANRNPDGFTNLVDLIATAPDMQAWRAEIEALAGLVDGPKQAQVTSNLRSPQQFQSTYHELLVGDYLNRLGLSPQYEVDIDGLTPDWYVPRAGQRGALIVEVITLCNEVKAEKADKNTAIFLGRLHGLTQGIALSVDWIDGHPPTLDGATQKAIVGEVERWLKTAPTLGAVLTTHGVNFEVASTDPSLSKVYTIGPPTAFFVGQDRMREKLREKASKYKDLADRQDLLFAWAAFANLKTGLSVNNFDDALRGKLGMVVRRDPDGNYWRGQERKGDGLLHRYDRAVAGIWCERRHRDTEFTVVTARGQSGDLLKAIEV